MANHQELSNFIWQVADLLRGPYRPPQYERVMFPMFYNTGIGTYLWIVTNRKDKRRKGKIQLVDARERWHPMRRSLGDKRRELGDDDITAIVREYGAFRETETAKTFGNSDFGYTRVTVERPLRLKFQITDERTRKFLDEGRLRDQLQPPLLPLSAASSAGAD